MIRPASLLAVLLLIGGCQRSKPDVLPADAQVEAQARTSAKAVADIAAAEDASQTPSHAERDRPQALSTAPKTNDSEVSDLSLNESASR